VKNKPPIRILVADDHAIVREGLGVIISLQKDMLLIAQAADGEEAIALYARHKPDIVLLDLRMPKKDGFQVVTELIGQDPKARIIIITTYDGDEDIRRSLKAGAKAYLLKDSPRQEIWNTIRLVYDGHSSLPPAIAAKIAASFSKPELSEREKEVLHLIALGRSNKKIGSTLHISEGTVKNHVKSLLSKLDAMSRTEAIAIASKRGLVSLS
jgi:two-component system NarL family response regulator